MEIGPEKKFRTVRSGVQIPYRPEFFQALYSLIKRSSVIPELWLIVKVTVVDVLLPRTLIETLIREDDLNFDRY